MIELKLSGVKEFKEILEGTKNVLNGGYIFEEAGKRAKEYAQNIFSPVDTGTLRESIYYESDDTSFSLGAEAPYAVFNEYGSLTTPIGSVESPIPAKYQGFRPFLRPAIYKARDEMQEIFGKKLTEITKQGMRMPK